MNVCIRLHKTGGKKIYADPEYGEGIYLYPGEIKKLKLKDGDSISEEELERFRQEYAVPRAKKRALGILVKKDCTEKELRQKLEKSFHDPISIEKALSFVRSQGYVDDEAYARDYLHFKREKKSFRQIRMELTKKGVPDSILSLVFEEAGEQQEEDLRRHVEKYIRKFPKFDKTAQQKTCAHFYRKGYSGELIRRIIENLDV